jgi:hypothetical protein
MATLLGAPAPAVARDAAAKDTVMETFFRGRTHAEGTFRAINGTRSDLYIALRGTVTAKGLTLQEDIRYNDGKTERKTWRFVRTGPTTYSGTREDVIGGTTVRVDGRVVRFNYLVDLDPGPKQDLYRFFDTLTFSADGKTMANTAIVWKAIFPVARARIDFRK